MGYEIVAGVYSSTVLRNSKLGVVSALVLAGSMWFYFECVLIPYQIADAAAHDRPRGNLSDLYPRWLGARELLLHHRDPYSAEVTREIQAGYYGRPLDPARRGDPEDQSAFAYPVYVVFPLAPTLRLPFDYVRQGFHWFLLLLTGTSVLLWLQALRWKPQLSLLLVFVFLILGSFPVVQGVKLQQLSLMVAGLLAAACAALVAGHLALAGVLLALAAIKPQLAILLTAWLLLWAVYDWRLRKRFAIAWAVTMTVLLAGAQLVLPGWIGRFWMALGEYHRYTHNVSVVDWLFTPVLGKILAAILLLISFALCRPFLNENRDSERLGVALSLILALTAVVVPMMATYNHVFLLPALILLARGWQKLWNGSLLMRMLFVVTGVALFWPWLASMGLMLATLVWPPATVQSHWQLPIITTFTFPIFVFTLMALHVSVFVRRRVPAAQLVQMK